MRNRATRPLPLLLALLCPLLNAQEYELLDAAIETPLPLYGIGTMQSTGQDAAGNVYVVTSLNEQMEWTIGSDVTQYSGTGLIVMKFDRARKIAFVHLFEGVRGGDHAYFGFHQTHQPGSIAVAPNGDFYFKGILEEPVDFDPGPGEHVLEPSGKTHFLAKYDAGGNLYWAKILYANVPQSHFKVGHLTLMPDGGVLMSLLTRETVDLDPGEDVHEVVIENEGPATTAVIALMIFSPDGGFEDAHLLHIVHEGEIRLDSELPSTHVDDIGRIFVEGWLQDDSRGDINIDVDFDPGPGVYNTDRSGTFRLHLNPDGSLIAACVEHSPDSSSQHLNVGAVGFAESNQVTIYSHNPSYYAPEILPGPGVLHLDPPNFYLLQLTPDNGYIRHAAFFQQIGTSHHAIPYHVAKAPNGDILVAGIFSGPLDLDPGPGEHIVRSAGDIHNAFLIRLSAELEYIDGWAITGTTLIDSGRFHAFDYGDLWWQGRVQLAGSLDLDPTAGTLEIDNGSEETQVNPSWRYVLWLGPPNPDVVSIARLDPALTNASSVRYAVTFEESVFGVDETDFEVAVNGTLNGAAITGLAGTGASYEVTVFGGTGDGDLRLNLVDDDSITNGMGRFLGGKAAGNGDFMGETYTLDRTPPAIAISPPSAGATATGPVTYVVTYSDFENISLTAGDVSLIATGTANGAVSILNSAVDERVVVVDNITGDGSIAIVIGTGTATDAAGNMAPAAGPSALFTVDSAAMAVNIGPPSAFIAGPAPVLFEVTYDNASSVTLSPADINLTETGTASGDVTVSGSGSATRMVTIDNLTGDGTIAFDIDAGTATGSGSSPAAGPSLSFTVDTSPPAVVGVEGGSAKAIQSFIVTFSEPVTGVDASDFTPRSGFGAFVTGVSGPSPGAVYTVSVNAAAAFGPLILAVEDDDTIVDLAGNPLGGPGAGNGSVNDGPAALPLAAVSLTGILAIIGAWTLRKRRRSA